MVDALTILRQKLPELRASERRVAEAIIADPSLVVELSITQLAQRCETSPATVARMCQALDLGGYRQFRVAVAAADSQERAARDLFQVDEANIGPDDSAADVIAKVAYQEARAIEETARAIDPDVVDRVVRAIRQADRVEVFGVGASGLTAHDLQLKLHRIGVTCFAWTDIHLGLTSAALSTARTLGIAVSHSGGTAEAWEFLNAVRGKGGTTLAVTNFPGSPVASVADDVLTTSTREGQLRTGAMSSRIAQMAIVDFIMVRLVQADFARAQSNLKETYDALRSRRLPPRPPRG